MHLEVTPVLDSDFPELVTEQWRSFENPYSGIIRAAAPILNNDRAASLSANIHLQLNQHQAAQPMSQWIKVVDNDAEGKLVGAARWMVFEQGTLEFEEKMTGDWWPEGSLGREFASKFFEQMNTARKQKAKRPHLYLHIAFTVPEYRGRGIGTMLVIWGTQKADSMGVECWLEASDLGRPVYRKHGFVDIVDFFIEPKMDEDQMSEDERKELEYLREIMPPIHVTSMWRPKGGIYVDGETVKP